MFSGIYGSCSGTRYQNIQYINYCFLLDKSCKAEEFYCPSGLCVPWNLTCNGVWNCPDGADEPSVCSIGEGSKEI